MNIDRGQENFEPEEVMALQRRLSEYKHYESLTWGAIASKTGVPAGTISQWATGKYQGDNAAVAYKVNKFFLAEEARQQLELQAPIVPAFQQTATARQMMGQMRWAQRGKMVIMVGNAGMGKTAAISQYCATTPNAFHATMAPDTRSPSTMMIEVLRSVGVTSRGGGSLQTLKHVLCDRLEGTNSVLILDEANHLNDLALEMIRAVHDRIGVGLVLAGNATVLTRIQGVARQADFAQLSSRVSMPHYYDKPQDEDIAILCAAWGITNAKERAFLANIAGRPGHLRNLTETLELATLLAGQQDEERTLEHIDMAWRQRAPRAAA